MNKDWPTKEKDMQIAQLFMEEFARDNEKETLGLFELVVNKIEKRMDYRLSDWVVALANHFKQMYGTNKGFSVTRRVISQYIRKGHTIH